MERTLSESRPTPLDKPAVRDFANVLADDIITQARNFTNQHDEYFIDDNDELLRSSFQVADVKTKGIREFPVIVRSIVHSQHVNHGDILVGAGAGEVNGEFIVEIVINGAYTWQKLSELKHQLVKDLYEALLHELTHAADHEYDNLTKKLGKPHYFMPDGTIDDAEYYNDPREVRAFLQEAVDEALARAESFVRTHRGENVTREQVLEYVYRGTAWVRVQKNMNERNRAKVLKAVYAALVDAGWI